MATRARAAAMAIRPLGGDQGLSAPIPADVDASPSHLIDFMVSDPDIVQVSRRLFLDGHFARSVEEAFKCLNNYVKKRAGMTTKDGPDLMFHAFDVDAPVLRINRLRSASDKDEQAGYRQIMAGSMTGLRNPRAHEHLVEDDPEAALEMLVLANHLMRILRRTKRTRRSQSPRVPGRPGPRQGGRHEPQ